jgi:uncharacterized membrane protein YphA (DoxX/SURF4 family)
MNKNSVLKLNWILLGLLMVVPGLLKLFVIKPAAITEMLVGLGFPVASFFTWVLIIGEILSGLAILFKWKLEKVVWFPIAVILIAGFTVHWGNWPNVIMHLAVASNYWLLGFKKGK